MSPNWVFESSWKGVLDYQSAWDLQLQLGLEIKSGARSDLILGLEHPHVITLGKRSKLDPEVPEGPTVWVDRGGEATVHSEGQLVIYPLIKLKPRFEVRTWVEFLHEVTKRTLHRMDIPTERGENSGLWTNRGKIAFMGLRIKDGVSLHGVSINVCNDLGLFGSMKACGIKGASLDSFRERGLSVQSQDLFQVWMEEFRLLACP